MTPRPEVSPLTAARRARLDHAERLARAQLDNPGEIEPGVRDDARFYAALAALVRIAELRDRVDQAEDA